MELAGGDRLIAAAHEAREHLAQPLPMPNHPSGTAGDARAYRQLTPEAQAAAPRYGASLTLTQGHGLMSLEEAAAILSRIQEP
jgi:hypothetical protein